jgi:outer membrane autotransporter protein
MLECARINRTATGFAKNWSSRGLCTAGIVLAVSLFAASGAQAQNCVIPFNQNIVNLGGIGSSPASVSSMIGSTIASASTAFLLQSTAFIGSPPNPQPDQEGGGVWVRGVGGEVSVKSSTNTTVTSTVSSPVLPPLSTSSSVSCVQKVDTDFVGVQFGKDFGILNINGWNVHWGATAGYIGTNGHIAGGAVSFVDQFDNVNVGGGAFNSTTNIPFIGAYAAATYGGFSIDALLRTEYYQTSLNAPGVNLFGQNIDAQGITFASSAAYQWQVPNSNWFIEPSAGIIISRIKVDPFNYLTAGASSPLDDRINGTLNLNDIHSDIGRLGLRFGTSIDSGNVVWQPFASVSVWHEFGPNITSNYATCPGCVRLFANTPVGPIPIALLPTSASSSTTNIGTFGQYSLGVSATVPGTGWLGFVRVDFRDGPNLEGWSGTGGIRYQFTPEGAPKPLPIKTKAPQPPVVEAINWTGFYLGAFGGATQGRADWGYAGGAASPFIGGFMGGGNIGYNYQVGRYVLGLEADLAGTNTKGGTGCAPPSVGQAFLFGIFPVPVSIGPMFQMTCNAKTDWLATATARLGYTWDRSLFYVKGGGAWTDEKFSATCNTAPANFPCTNPAGFNLLTGAGSLSTGFTADTHRTGWVLGFGAEFAFTRNWSAKAETDYISFGDTNVIASDGSPLRVGMHVWEEKIGVNYRF